jgi:hypothetical protein
VERVMKRVPVVISTKMTGLYFGWRSFFMEVGGCRHVSDAAERGDWMNRRVCQAARRRNFKRVKRGGPGQRIRR